MYGVMVATAWPNPENCSQDELEVAMKAALTKRAYQRLHAIRALVLGFDHGTIAELLAVSVDSLNRWVARFNDEGIDGLIDRARSGRPRKISPEQTLEYIDLIENPGKAGQQHWTAKKFHGHLSEALGHEVGYSTVLRWLHDNDFRLKVPQPWPDRQNEPERQAWVEQLRVLLADPDAELWYMDEMGVEGDPRPRRRWAKIGKKTRVTHNGDHLRMNVTGMICPRTGEAFLLEFTHNDREVFQVFLDEANRDLTAKLERKRQVLICDNASWHKCKSLRWGKFEPLYLPAYSPDLNPIERLWLRIKAEWFSDFVAKTREELIGRLDQALNWAMARRDHNTRTCAIKAKL
jgi:transposase